MRGLNHPGAVSEKARSTVHAAKHGQHMDNHGQTMALIASGGLPAARLARLPHPWEGRARGERGEEACVDGGRSPCSKHGSPHLNMALIAPGRPGIAVHAANIDNPKQNMALIAPGGGWGRPQHVLHRAPGPVPHPGLDRWPARLRPPVRYRRHRRAATLFLLFDIVSIESGTTGSRTNQAASFPTPSATASAMHFTCNSLPGMKDTALDQARLLPQI